MNSSRSDSKKQATFLQNGKKMELQRKKSQFSEKSMARRQSVRERKMALLQDVENLKKKLRQEENVHRALERAFTRPLGSLPRLPSYLPKPTLELLAEVAVLEEEVLRLEEKVVHFREGLYLEAAHISSRNISLLSSISSKQRHSRSLCHGEGASDSLGTPIHQRASSARKLLPEDSVSDGLRHSFNSPSNGKQRLKVKFLESEDVLARQNRCSPELSKEKMQKQSVKNANTPMTQASPAQATS